MNMKTKLGIFLAGCCLLAFTACEKDLQPYNTPGAWLNFAFRESSGDLITSSEGLYDEIYDTYYSFALQSATTGTDITQDTVWVEVSTMGFLSEQDRQVELLQVVTGENDAVPGVHYVAFDDPALLAKSYVAAGQNLARVPIVVLRDASLDQHDVVLKIAIKDNGVFKPGYEEFSTRTLHISAQLAKPSNWDSYYMDYMFGTYTPTKHALMIEWTGKLWDDAYLEELNNGDYGYQEYLATWMKEKLEEENQKRLDAGEDILREPDGTPVTFDMF